MKKVAVIYRDRSNGDAIQHLTDNLSRIFLNYIQIENYFLEEITEDTSLQADAFLVVHEDMLSSLKKHVFNFQKIILMHRSINRACVPSISEIPRDTDILVVNDSYESTIETVNAFYELGIGHLNLIPYEEDLAAQGVYNNVRIAVTPNEIDLVPSHIGTVINIGYREISFDTLFKLMHKLDLDIEVINRNLNRHIHSVVESNSDFHSNYRDSYLKSQMLNRVVQDSASAIILLSEAYQVVYSNSRAKAIFGLEDDAPCSIASLVDNATLACIRSDDSKDQLIQFNGESYVMEKAVIMLMDEIMGYCITLQNERNLRELEINLNSHLRKKGLYARYHFQDFIHRSDAMKLCLATAKRVAVTDHTILIRGESGTGKELLAQSIHNYSLRNYGPFVAVNCAALPESLLESELFGYEGGSFTGAQKNGKLGLFEQARTGTIFLDEVGDISPKLQSRLLRAIQEKQIMRIGSDKVINVDVRIVAATNKNLEDEIQKSTFRSDLFYRLNVIPLVIEPLRQRKDDIIPLLSHFLGEDFRNVTDEETQRLLHYHWPGNVRELESAAIYYHTLGKFPDFSAALPDQNSNGPERIPAAPTPRTSPGPLSREPENVRFVVLQLISEASQAFHGIGRSVLLQKLSGHRIALGDSKLRELLAQLESQGLITVGKGRCGSQITLKGLDFINESRGFHGEENI